VPTGERRRFVILNTQPGVSQYEVLYISANFSGSQAAAVRSIIDSVELSIAGEPTEFVITTQISPPGAGTINGGGVYSPDEEVTLSVTGNPGYRFVQWQGNVSNPNSAETTITATDDAMVKAVFVRQWQLVLDAQVGGSASGGGGYDNGTIVPFTATPDDGYRFDGWTGTGTEDALGTETTVTLNESHMATVTFVKVWGLEVAAGDGGNVSGGGTFDHGALAPISATVSDGYRFGGWSGEGIADVSALETTVMMGEESTVRASFVKVWNLEVGGNEGGAVEGSGVVDAGISTPIVAIVSEGYRFDGWTGPNIAGSNMRETTIAVNADTAATARFVKVWKLDITRGDGGTAQGGGIVDAGAVVPIMASPSEGFRFGGWLGDGIADATAAESMITVNSDTQAMATFVQVWSLNLTVSDGGMVQGAGTFDDGAEVSITALANEGHEFVRWEGSDSITDPRMAETEVTIAEALKLTAIFMVMATEPRIDADSDGDGLPDIWEMANGLDSRDPADAFDYSDKDSYTNAEEYVALTDPQNPQSRLMIVKVVREAAGLTLQWTSTPGVTYQIEANNDLSTSWGTVAIQTAEMMMSELVGIDPEAGPTTGSG